MLGFIFMVAVIAFIMYKFWIYVNREPLMNEPKKSIADVNIQDQNARDAEVIQREHLEELANK